MCLSMFDNYTKHETRYSALKIYINWQYCGLLFSIQTLNKHKIFLLVVSLLNKHEISKEFVVKIFILTLSICGLSLSPCGKNNYTASFVIKNIINEDLLSKNK